MEPLDSRGTPGEFFLAITKEIVPAAALSNPTAADFEAILADLRVMVIDEANPTVGFPIEEVAGADIQAFHIHGEPIPQGAICYVTYTSDGFPIIAKYMTHKRNIVFGLREELTQAMEFCEGYIRQEYGEGINAPPTIRLRNVPNAGGANFIYFGEEFHAGTAFLAPPDSPESNYEMATFVISSMQCAP